VLGVEPARNVATFAETLGIPTRCEFFGREFAEGLMAEGIRPDIIHAHNVLAHVPDREWNIREAWIANAAGGERVVDFASHNLHVLGYSVPVRARLSRDRLKEHLFSLPATPDWIPYRTSYYSEAWGFCLAHAQLEAMGEGEYEVCTTRRSRTGTSPTASACSRASTRMRC
jgi:aminopeptidase-like protein